MNRREFVLTSSMASLSAVSMGLNYREWGRGLVTASDLQDYLRTLYPVSEPSVDRIVIGDPGTKIRKAGACWMPYFRTIRKARELGINVMVVHEPTFYAHWDLDEPKGLFYRTPSPAREKYLEAVERKKKWINDNKMVIIRCHDVLDIVKGFGIPFALGQALGFTNDDIIQSKDYYNVYRIKPDIAWNVAMSVANSLTALNQPGIAFYGDRGRMVSSIGLGTGCICDPVQYQELEPGLSIAVDDTIRTWTQTVYSEDTGDPLVVINHGTAEESGTRLLNAHLSGKFPELEFLHLDQGCTYRWIAGN
jgi:putative NIF3 family GTP cyclohydrolase 1 type 2